MGRCLKITIHEVEEHSEEIAVEEDRPLQSLQKYLYVLVDDICCLYRKSATFRMVVTMYTTMRKI